MKILLVCLTVFKVLRVAAQDFVNLDFNSPDLSGSLVALDPGSPRTPYLGSASELLRGWTVYGDGVPLQRISYQPGIGNSFEPVTLAFTRRASPAAVNYELVVDSRPPRMIDLTFHQRGQVPVNASSLSFVSGGLMEMRINGDLIYSSNPNVTAFPSVDVSRFSGQVVDLDFHVFQISGSGALFSFDVVGFSQVPEPSTWALFGVGAVFLAAASLRRYKN
jgi:PEP-CTERM motif